MAESILNPGQYSEVSQDEDNSQETQPTQKRIQIYWYPILGVVSFLVILHFKQARTSSETESPDFPIYFNFTKLSSHGWCTDIFQKEGRNRAFNASGKCEKLCHSDSTCSGYAEDEHSCVWYTDVKYTRAGDNASYFVIKGTNANGEANCFRKTSNKPIYDVKSICKEVYSSCVHQSKNYCIAFGDDKIGLGDRMRGMTLTTFLGMIKCVPFMTNNSFHESWEFKDKNHHCNNMIAEKNFRWGRQDKVHNYIKTAYENLGVNESHVIMSNYNFDRSYAFHEEQLSRFQDMSHSQVLGCSFHRFMKTTPLMNYFVHRELSKFKKGAKIISIHLRTGDSTSFSNMNNGDNRAEIDDWKDMVECAKTLEIKLFPTDDVVFSIFSDSVEVKKAIREHKLYGKKYFVSGMEPKHSAQSNGDEFLSWLEMIMISKGDAIVMNSINSKRKYTGRAWPLSGFAVAAKYLSLLPDDRVKICQLRRSRKLESLDYIAI